MLRSIRRDWWLIALGVFVVVLNLANGNYWSSVGWNLIMLRRILGPAELAEHWHQLPAQRRGVFFVVSLNGWILVVVGLLHR